MSKESNQVERHFTRCARTANEILVRGVRDYVDFGTIEWISRSLSKPGASNESLSLASTAIVYLLEAELAIIGELHKDGVVSWGVEPRSAIDRVRAGWPAQGTYLRPDDIGWLELSSAGKLLGAQLIRDGFQWLKA